MKVTLYTDGAARGNPDGPGGYGAVLQFVDKEGTLHEKELSAGYVKTTNCLLYTSHKPGRPWHRGGGCLKECGGPGGGSCRRPGVRG